MRYSPLRYYGGKRRGMKKLREFFPTNFSKYVLVDVFTGSMSVPMNLPGLKRAIVNDAYDDLQNFWWVVRGYNSDKTDTDMKYPLYEKFKVEHDSMIYNVKYIHNLLDEIEKAEGENKKVLRAAYFYLVNRIKYSGMQDCKDTSGFHSLPGGNVLHEDLNEWHDWFKGKDIRIWNLDFRECLERVNKMNPKTLNLFIYLDPPYVAHGDTYKHKMDEQDHRDLAGMLANTEHNWLLSYDPDPLVYELYEDMEGVRIENTKWQYSSTNGNITNGRLELIITNNKTDVFEI
jgi:site-specific DNA-adenine methylase